MCCCLTIPGWEKRNTVQGEDKKKSCCLSRQFVSNNTCFWFSCVFFWQEWTQLEGRRWRWRVCQLQCLMNLLLEIVACTRHLYKGTRQISPGPSQWLSLAQKSAGMLLVMTFLSNMVTKVLSLRFLNTSEKTIRRLNLIIRMTYAFHNRNSWREAQRAVWTAGLFVKVLLSCGCCLGGEEVEPPGRWKAPLLSASDSPQSAWGEFGMFKEESRSTLNCLMDVHMQWCSSQVLGARAGCDAHKTSPTKGTAGSQCSCWLSGLSVGALSKVHWKVLVLPVPGLAASNVGFPTVFISIEVSYRVVSCETRL